MADRYGARLLDCRLPAFSIALQGERLAVHLDLRVPGSEPSSRTARSDSYEMMPRSGALSHGTEDGQTCVVRRSSDWKCRAVADPEACRRRRSARSIGVERCRSCCSSVARAKSGTRGAGVRPCTRSSRAGRRGRALPRSPCDWPAISSSTSSRSLSRASLQSKPASA